MTAVKLGMSRQVAIPKKIHDEIGLIPVDYLEVELVQGTFSIVKHRENGFSGCFYE